MAKKRKPRSVKPKKEAEVKVEEPKVDLREVAVMEGPPTGDAAELIAEPVVEKPIDSPPIAEGVKSRIPAEPVDDDAMIQCCNCLGMAKAKETFRCSHCGKGGCKACGWWPIKSGYCPNCATPVPKQAMGN